MLWLMVHLIVFFVFPPAVFFTLILHLFAMGDKARSKRREREIENAVTKALKNAKN